MIDARDFIVCAHHVCYVIRLKTFHDSNAECVCSSYMIRFPSKRLGKIGRYNGKPA